MIINYNIKTDNRTGIIDVVNWCKKTFGKKNKIAYNGMPPRWNYEPVGVYWDDDIQEFIFRYEFTFLWQSDLILFRMTWIDV